MYQAGFLFYFCSVFFQMYPLFHGYTQCTEISREYAYIPSIKFHRFCKFLHKYHKLDNLLRTQTRSKYVENEVDKKKYAPKRRLSQYCICDISCYYVVKQCRKSIGFTLSFRCQFCLIRRFCIYKTSHRLFIRYECKLQVGKRLLFFLSISLSPCAKKVRDVSYSIINF